MSDLLSTLAQDEINLFVIAQFCKKIHQLLRFSWIRFSRRITTNGVSHLPALHWTAEAHQTIARQIGPHISSKILLKYHIIRLCKVHGNDWWPLINPRQNQHQLSDYGSLCLGLFYIQTESKATIETFIQYFIIFNNFLIKTHVVETIVIIS